MDSASSTATPTAAPTSGFDGVLGGGANKSDQYQNATIVTFFTSLGASLAVFAIQVLVFLLLKGKLPRIYQPRTYLVPEKARTKAPPSGIWQWIIPVFRTGNSEFIQKCGLDAYFFLRFLRMLLKIFIPMAIIILPILLPMNAVGGINEHFAEGIYGPGPGAQNWTDVTGLNQLAWVNVRPDQYRRYWTHLLLAELVIGYCCYVFFDELRGYIRLRQAYLTSPQHRLRASATTVLVSSIPRKWCTPEALEGLYDVFPGGIRNIWINRNYDELNDKVQLRNRLAKKLESAGTNLIKNCKKAQIKARQKEEKTAGTKATKEEKAAQDKRRDERAAALAGSQGLSTNNPHQVHHTIDEELYGSESNHSSRSSSKNRGELKSPLDLVGQGVEAVGKGITNVGKTLLGGIKGVGKDVDNVLGTTQGFQIDGANQNESQERIATAEAAAPSQSTADQKSIEAADSSTEPKSKVASLHEAERTGSKSSLHKDPLETRSSDKAVGVTGSPNTAVEEARPQTSDTHDFAEKPRAVKPPPNTTALNPRTPFHFWRTDRNVLEVPSPNPHAFDGDEFPLQPIGAASKDRAGEVGSEDTRDGGGKLKKVISPTTHGNVTKREDYAAAFDESYDPNAEDPVWKKYIQQKDRDTLRVPYLGWWWLSWLPFFGHKVDTIDYCRKEVARLNLEIEQDQKEPEKFPHMNSAFIQFNHQVAAHLACQSVSHHIPNQMAPRAIEISPDDVIWDNMSVKWWERYLRTGLIFIIIIGLIVAWAIPVAFTGALSQISSVSKTYNWLAWLDKVPAAGQSAVQGLLPPLLLALLLLILPLVLRLLARAQGIQTGMMVELALSNYYFLFLFVQVFLVVTLASGITQVISEVTKSVTNIPSVLANNLPKASNYFFSYLILQALSTSSGALLQIGQLFFWFIWASMVDSTPRDKWARQVNLPNVQWGTFFPLYTVFAVIGLVYSTIAPLILVFNIITFSLFWVAYRYTTLYVTKFTRDTGGLLFPKAINHLFVGLYVMELCLIGLFFLVRDIKINPDNGLAVTDESRTPCLPQAIIMIVSLVITAGYQLLLNRSFSPLFRYLPITLEDDAVARDEEFARTQAKKWQLVEDNDKDGDGEDDEDIHDALEARERRSEEADREAEAAELARAEAARRGRLDPRRLVPDTYNTLSRVPGSLSRMVPGGWAERSRERARARRSRSDLATDGTGGPGSLSDAAVRQHRLRSRTRRTHGPPAAGDAEAGTAGSGDGTHEAGPAMADALFAGLHDEIEDLTPDERDALVRRAFQHEALRARRPVVWLPRDDLGVSDDEVRRTERLSKYLWTSNDFAGLDGRGKVVYRRSPPDFTELDLIEL